MKSVPIPPPADEVDKTTRDHRENMKLFEFVTDSIAANNNNQRLNLNDVMNYFKSESYFALDDLERFKPVIVEFVNQKINEAEI